MGQREYKIYIFRHDRTVFNTKGIFTGWKNLNICNKYVTYGTKRLQT